MPPPILSGAALQRPSSLQNALTTRLRSARAGAGCRWACIVIFLCAASGDYLANYFPAWVGRQVIKAIRGELFAHYLRLPTAQYDRESSAMMLTRLTYNAELVASARPPIR